MVYLTHVKKKIVKRRIIIIIHWLKYSNSPAYSFTGRNCATCVIYSLIVFINVLYMFKYEYCVKNTFIIDKVRVEFKKKSNNISLLVERQ